MSRREKNKANNRIKISLAITAFILISIVTTIIVVTIVPSNNKTEEVSEIIEVENTKVADVTDSNIKLEYNKEPTEEPVNLSIKEYDKNYSLYYYVQEIIQNEENNEEKEINTEERDFALLESDTITIERNSTISFKYEKDGIFSENTYELEISNIIDKGEIQEGATEKELQEQKVDKKDKSNNVRPYYIKVNIAANCVTIYKKDDNDDYTIPVKAMVCSIGVATPSGGVYKTSNKYGWRYLVGGVYGQYATRIVGSILFHSVPYFSASHDDLEYLEYDKLGTKASAGCVRLTVADAKWIYDNCSSGTMVEFYSDSNPGPLGKPSAQKISSVIECRGWDPTDPAAGNPWRTWNGKLNQNTNNNTQSQKQNNTQNQSPVTPDTHNNTNTQNNENNNDDKEENQKDPENNTQQDNDDNPNNVDDKEKQENTNTVNTEEGIGE